MSYTDVSIDLETLGVQPGSVITQIGLCAFDQRPGTTTKSSTLIRVDAQDAINRGCKVDWSTVRWWMQQEQDARMDFADPAGLQIRHSLPDALRIVRQWFGEHVNPNAGKSGYRTMRVWGHGCGFDCTQLEIAFNLCKIDVPWDFRLVRDLRTLADLTPAQPVTRPTPALAHNAMEDAMAQADWIQALTYQIEKRNVGMVIEQPQG